MSAPSLWKPCDELHVHVLDEEWTLDASLHHEVEDYWRHLQRRGTDFFRGPVLTVEGIESFSLEDHIYARWTDYAHFLYSRQFLKPHDRGYVRVLFAAGCLVTAEGDWLVAMMNEATTRPGWIQVVGGSPTPEDVVEGQFCAMTSVAREMREETGFNSQDVTQVRNMAVKGYTVDAVDMSIAVAVRVDMALFTHEALQHFRQHRAMEERPELKKLLALPSGESGVRRLKEFGEPTVRYLLALLTAPELR